MLDFVTMSFVICDLYWLPGPEGADGVANPEAAGNGPESADGAVSSDVAAEGGADRAKTSNEGDVAGAGDGGESAENEIDGASAVHFESDGMFYVEAH